MSAEGGGASMAGGSESSRSAASGDGGAGAEKFRSAVSDARPKASNGAGGEAGAGGTGSPAAAKSDAQSPKPSASADVTAAGARDEALLRRPSASAAEAYQRTQYASAAAQGAISSSNTDYNALAAAQATQRQAKTPEEKAKAAAELKTAQDQFQAAQNLNRAASSLSSTTAAFNASATAQNKAALDRSYQSYQAARNAYESQTLMTKQKYASSQVAKSQGLATRTSDLHKAVSFASQRNPVDRTLQSLSQGTGQLMQASQGRLSAARQLQETTNRYATASAAHRAAENALKTKPNDPKALAARDSAAMAKATARAAMDKSYAAYTQARASSDAMTATMREKLEKTIPHLSNQAQGAVMKAAATASLIGPKYAGMLRDKGIIPPGSHTPGAGFTRAGYGTRAVGGMAQGGEAAASGNTATAVVALGRAAIDAAGALNPSQTAKPAISMGSNGFAAGQAAMTAKAALEKMQNGDVSWPTVTAFVGGVLGAASSSIAVVNGAITYSGMAVSAGAASASAAVTSASQAVQAAQAAKMEAVRAGDVQAAQSTDLALTQAQSRLAAAQSKLDTWKKLEVVQSYLDKYKKITGIGGDVADLFGLAQSGIANSPLTGPMANFMQSGWWTTSSRMVPAV